MAQTKTTPKRWWHISLYVQVIIAVIAGVILARVAPSIAVEMKFFSDLFINSLKAILGPIIFCTVVNGIAGAEKPAGAGKTAGIAMVYFTLMTIVALTLGMVVAHIAAPGSGMNINPSTLDSSALASYTKTAKETNFTLAGQILHLIPHTFTAAFVDGEILQILVVAIVFAAAMARIDKKHSQPVLTMIGSVSEIFFSIIKMLMVLAPAAAFGAIAFTTGQFGVKSLLPQLKLVVTFYMTGLFFVLTVFAAICRWCGFNVISLCRYFKDELLLVLGTSSSETALPSLMKKLELLGVPRDTVSIVVPTGYSFNLVGTAMAMTLSIMFLAQALNIDLTLYQQVQILLLCMLTSKGAAGVVGAGMVVLVSTLQTSGMIPVAAATLLLGVDRFVSECRALVNFIGNTVATIAVAKYEGRLDLAMLKKELALPTPSGIALAATHDSWDEDHATTPVVAASAKLA